MDNPIPSVNIPLNILIVEDEDAHAELIMRCFERCRDKFNASRASSLKEALQSIAENMPDLVISDWRLPDGEGIELITGHNGKLCGPVVIMTSFGDENMAVEAIKAGALDYVVKSVETMNDMQHIAERAIREWQHFITRKKAESALNEHQAKLSSVFRAAPTGICVAVNRIIQEVNDRFCELTGYSQEELIGHSSKMLYADQSEYEKVGIDHYHNIPEHGNCSLETVWRRKNGQLINILLISTPIVPGNVDDGLTFIILDITERKKIEKEKLQLEEKLIKAQKMESIGRLAGGVAHDFNNLLTPILGYAELLLKQVEQGDKKRDALMEIKLAAQRARDLTRQLLAFGRKQTLELKPTNLVNVIRGFEKLLNHTLRENISLEIKMPEELTVNADTGQLEQVLMNLIVNAQDAMPDGGKICLSMQAIDIENNQDGIEDGSYAMISVTDNGTGMDPETMDRIFEPFFTTKEVNKGTGLGLSSVYGIIRQHKGYIKVESQLNCGSTFKIYLQLTGNPVHMHESGEFAIMPHQVSEGTILLVEDNEVVRQVTCMMLEQMGYTVISTSNPHECLSIMTNLNLTVDLLLTDVIMPDINGKELYKKIKEIRPDLKVLYMSGYPSNVISSDGGLDSGTFFIQKPFATAALERKIQEVIHPQ